MKAVILCGGKASRMGKICLDTPKAMTYILQKNVLEHQIDALKEEGIDEIILVTGHLNKKIKEYFSDGKQFGIKINYFIEKTPLGTAGALFKLNLKEDFLLCGGDLIFKFNFKKMLAFHKKNNALATLFTHPNTHPHDSTLIEADESGKVCAITEKTEDKSCTRNLCNAGIEIVSPKLLELYVINGKADFDKDLIKPAIKSGRIFSYKSAEYVHDMGTPERLEKVREDILNNKPQKMYSENPRRAIFLDRDGTINIHRGFITSPEEIEIIDKADDAIAEFNRLGFLVIVITNQPVIARGECTLDELQKIHGRVEFLLGKKGAFLDEIYFCPHHPDKGFEGEREEYKIICNCRKPDVGLFLQAQKDFNIDMENSYMAGDSLSDVSAAEKAGCHAVLISANKTDKDVLKFDSLWNFCEYIKDNERL